MTTNAVLSLARELIARPSITPNDCGCQELLAKRLQAIGFTCETIECGEVTNLWARRGKAKPMIFFAGHTDVVPPGPPELWTNPAFEPMERDGYLYGRGTADMKTSIAAFIIALEQFVEKYPNHPGSLGMLITSDEEGPATEGTVKVCEILAERRENVEYCIVGEPTSLAVLGDMCKNGRRGSLSGRLIVKGVQGHVAYPHLAKNPVHLVAPALNSILSTSWDEGNAYFPPTTFQVSNFHSGNGATNVIAAEAILDFNFRFSTASTPYELKKRVHDLLDKYELDYHIDWTLSGEPFITPRGELSAALTLAIEDEMGYTPELSTTGGTSDGRFIAKICTQVIEFGPVNATIHKSNECVNITSLMQLSNIYRRTLEHLLMHP